MNPVSNLIVFLFDQNSFIRFIRAKKIFQQLNIGQTVSEIRPRPGIPIINILCKCQVLTIIFNRILTKITKKIRIINKTVAVNFPFFQRFLPNGSENYKKKK